MKTVISGIVVMITIVCLYITINKDSDTHVTTKHQPIMQEKSPEEITEINGEERQDFIVKYEELEEVHDESVSVIELHNEVPPTNDNAYLIAKGENSDQVNQASIIQSAIEGGYYNQAEKSEVQAPTHENLLLQAFGEYSSEVNQEEILKKAKDDGYEQIVENTIRPDDSNVLVLPYGEYADQVIRP